MITFRRLCIVRVTQCCFSTQVDDLPKGLYEIRNPEELQVSNIQFVADSKYFTSNVEAYRLTLTVIDSEGLEIGSEYQIKSTGMKNSLRNQKDGIVYGGCLFRDENNAYINDIMLSEREGGVGGKHFKISYSTDRNSYFLQDLNDGTGTFVRIDKQFHLNNNNIISYGDSHMIVTFENDLNPTISLKFIDGPKVDNV